MKKQIHRLVFRIAGEMPERIEVIVDSEASTILSIRLLDLLASIYRPKRSDPNNFESYELAQEKIVSLFPQLLEAQQKQALYISKLGLNEFMF